MNSAFLRLRSALAVGQMIGLHRDPKIYNAKPLQAERARRLWWKLYDMDRALSLFIGRPYTIIDRFVDVELPCPYDDSDISVGTDGEMVIDKSRTGKTIMYYRIYK
jgi:Fungal specific transcription factor domain